MYATGRCRPVAAGRDRQKPARSGHLRLVTAVQSTLFIPNNPLGSTNSSLQVCWYSPACSASKKVICLMEEIV